MICFENFNHPISSSIYTLQQVQSSHHHHHHHRRRHNRHHHHHHHHHHHCYNGTKKQMRSVCLKSVGCKVPNFPIIRILNRTRCFWEVFLAYFNKAPPFSFDNIYNMIVYQMSNYISIVHMFIQENDYM